MILSYENLIQQMLICFPSLEKNMDSLEPYERQLRHIIFGLVFNPYMQKIFTDSSVSEEEKVKISNFLEQMATSEDKEVRAVLTDTIIEGSLNDPGSFVKIEQPYLVQ